MVYFKAFIVGGLICTLVQIFLDHTRLCLLYTSDAADE